MNNLVNFTMQLELLQNKIDYDEENLNYSNRAFKFAIDKNPKSKNAKKYFELAEAIDKVGAIKRRLVEIKKKREFREASRVAKNVPSLIGTNWGQNEFRNSAFSQMARQSRKYKMGLLDASRKMSEVREERKPSR